MQSPPSSWLLRRQSSHRTRKKVLSATNRCLSEHSAALRYSCDATFSVLCCFFLFWRSLSLSLVLSQLLFFIPPCLAAGVTNPLFRSSFVGYASFNSTRCLMAIVGCFLLVGFLTWPASSLLLSPAPSLSLSLPFFDRCCLSAFQKSLNDYYEDFFGEEFGELDDQMLWKRQRGCWAHLSLTHIAS